MKNDLTANGVRPAVSSPCVSDKNAFCAKTVETFPEESGVQLAVNGSYFYTFQERMFWDFRPRAGEHAFPLGIVISDRKTFAPPRPGYPSLCFSDGRASINVEGDCPEDTSHAIAGRVLIEPGVEVDERGFASKPYPLTLAGLDAGGETLFFFIVDGKQPFYSDGLKLRDGANGARTLNRPIRTRLPGRQRPIATHLGFYARPGSE